MPPGFACPPAEYTSSNPAPENPSRAFPSLWPPRLAHQGRGRCDSSQEACRALEALGLGAPRTCRRGPTVLSAEAPKSPSPPRPPGAFCEAAEQPRTPIPIGTLGGRPHRNQPAAARHAGSCSVSLPATEGGRQGGFQHLVPSHRDAPALQGPPGIPPTSTPSVPVLAGLNRKWAKAGVRTGALGCPEQRVAGSGRAGATMVALGNGLLPRQRAGLTYRQSPRAAGSHLAGSGPQPPTPRRASVGRGRPRPSVYAPSAGSSLHIWPCGQRLGLPALPRSGRGRGLPAATAGGGADGRGSVGAHILPGLLSLPRIPSSVFTPVFVTAAASTPLSTPYFYPFPHRPLAAPLSVSPLSSACGLFCDSKGLPLSPPACSSLPSAFCLQTFL